MALLLNKIKVPKHSIIIPKMFYCKDPFAEEFEGQFIIEEGRIYPSNDENAIGVVVKRADVTNSDVVGELLIHGQVDVYYLSE